MKAPAILSLLLVLGVASTMAQQQAAPPASEGVPMELLELEQDVDKTLLREAMMTLGRFGMNRESREAILLKEYVSAHKRAVIERSAEMRKLRAGSSPSAMTRGAPAADASPKVDKPRLIEQIENAQVDVQLLERQVQAFQGPLNEAIAGLANAELVASTDETQRASADEARKEFEKAKARYVEFSKKFQVEQSRVSEMQQQMGMGGMGGFR